MSFFKSIVRGAGNELGRSAMRAAINPIFKGKDATPISMGSSGNNQQEEGVGHPKRKTILSYIGAFCWLGLAAGTSMAFGSYGVYIMLVIGGGYILRGFLKDTIQEYGTYNEKITDRRHKRGYRVEKRYGVINEYESPKTKNRKTYYWVVGGFYLLFTPTVITAVEEDKIAEANKVTITIDDASPSEYDMSYITVSAYYDSTKTKYTHIKVDLDLNNIMQSQYNHDVSGEFFTEDGGILISNIDNKDEEMFNLLRKSHKVVFEGPNYSVSGNNKVVFVKNLHTIKEVFNQ